MSNLMDILKQQREKKDKKEKEKFRGLTFSRINAIVKEYQLGKEFIEKIDRFLENPFIEGVFPARAKKNFDPPVFFLSDEEHYRITKEIMKKLQNPYLAYSNSPDEILLSVVLYRLNPCIEESELSKFHFEVLIKREMQRKIIL